MNHSAEPPPLPETKPELSPRFSRLGAALAVGVIFVCVMFVLRMQTAHKTEGGDKVHPNRMLELMARYTVGVEELMRLSQSGRQSEMKNSPEGMPQAMLREVRKFSRTDEDDLRVLILEGWLKGAWPDENKLEASAAKNAGLQEDVTTLRELKARNGEAPDEAWKKLRQRHGWLADLARAQTTTDQETKRAVAQQGLGTAVGLMGVSLLGVCGAAGGLAVLIWGVVRWRSGKLCLTLARRSRAEGGVLLEGFAIFLALFLFPSWLLRQMSVPLPGWAAYAPAIIALIVGMTWPLQRGMQRAQWRAALGLHSGQGIWREVGAGVMGWLASLPLLVLGMVAASWIMKLTGDVPTHPIVDAFAGSRWVKLGAVLLAVVWAPMSEEIMFRGLLFPGLSAWLRWMTGVALSAFVFAVIHPQGWAGVPAIMVLAGSFCFLRIWRRSLIAPMTAHALNNGVMCVAMLLLW